MGRLRMKGTLFQLLTYPVAVTLVLNFLFLLVSLVVASSSPTPVIKQTVAAFATGDLQDNDFLDFDARRGNNQYNDCMVLQLLINPTDNVVSKALAPVAYVSDDTYSDVCATLHHQATGPDRKAGLYSDRYARYWHGSTGITALLLRVGTLANARLLLKGLVIASIITLFLAALTAPCRLQILGISISISSALFWGLPYFGQALSFAPGDSVVLFGTAALIFFWRRLRQLSALVTCAAAFGSLVTYFEFLTGQIPTVVCFLLVATYFIAQAPTGTPQTSGLRPWLVSLCACTAFETGSLLTVVIKQALAITLVGPEVFETFRTNLQLYLGLGNAVGGIETYLDPFRQLVEAAPVLTYGRVRAARLLLLVTAATWIIAAAMFTIRVGRRSDFLPHLAGAFGVAAWIMLLPTHAALHASFMVRILIVPISLGWSALVCEIAAIWSPRPNQEKREPG
jgi:hypothetical protein